MASFQVARFPVVPVHAVAGHFVLNSARPAVLPCVDPFRPSSSPLAPRAGHRRDASIVRFPWRSHARGISVLHSSAALHLRLSGAIVPVMGSGQRSVLFLGVRPNPSLNADVPGAGLRPRNGPPVSLYR